VREGLHRLSRDGRPDLAKPVIMLFLETAPTTLVDLHMNLGPRTMTHYMDATMFFDDCVFLCEWPGNPVTELEGEIGSGALGSKRSILLANHGLAAVGESVEEACWMALCLERAAIMQLRARSIGKLSAIDPDYARDAHDYLTDPSMIAMQFRRSARRLLRADPHCLD
jgi:L-fuculose-phosphate aldolase